MIVNMNAMNQNKVSRLIGNTPFTMFYAWAEENIIGVIIGAVMLAILFVSGLFLAKQLLSESKLRGGLVLFLVITYRVAWVCEILSEIGLVPLFTTYIIWNKNITFIAIGFIFNMALESEKDERDESEEAL